MIYKYCNPAAVISYDDHDCIFGLPEAYIFYSPDHLRREWPIDFYTLTEAADDFCAYEILLNLYGCLDADL
jgi:hypothetical protein